MKSCWLIDKPEPTPQLKIAVLYIAVAGASSLDSYGPRFTQTYIENPAGYPHKLVIVANGGPLNAKQRAYFNRLDCEFFDRQNDEGKDISAYQAYSARHPDAFLVCLGESVHFHKSGWLSRMAQSRIEYGPGIYGFMASHMVRAHLNTTAFGIDARLMNQYPPVTTNGKRYEFEHGRNCAWKRIHAGGNTAALVTFDGCWFPGEWRHPDNILHRGDQSNMPVFCNHSEKFQFANEATKALWQSQSDSPYRT